MRKTLAGLAMLSALCLAACSSHTMSSLANDPAAETERAAWIGTPDAMMADILPVAKLYGTTEPLDAPEKGFEVENYGEFVVLIHLKPLAAAGSGGDEEQGANVQAAYALDLVFDKGFERNHKVMADMYREITIVLNERYQRAPVR